MMKSVQHQPPSMQKIRIHDKEFVPFLSREAISERVGELANELNLDYAEKAPLFIAILNGSFIFAADLFRKLTIDAEICFVKMSSYKGTTSTGNIMTTIGLDVNIQGRDLVLLEDIVDTGNTLNQLLPRLEQAGSRSIRVCALLHKAEVTKHPIPELYSGFTIPDRFVIGYGLDYEGKGRNLDGIWQIS